MTPTALSPIHDELDGLEELLDGLADCSSPAHSLELLEQLDARLSLVRGRVADARSLVIDAVATAEGSSARKAAAELGLSLAAVSKASARARALAPTVSS